MHSAEAANVSPLKELSKRVNSNL